MATIIPFFGPVADMVILGLFVWILYQLKTLHLGSKNALSLQFQNFEYDKLFKVSMFFIVIAFLFSLVSIYGVYVSYISDICGDLGYVGTRSSLLVWLFYVQHKLNAIMPSSE